MSTATAGALTDASKHGGRRAREWRHLLGLGFQMLGLPVTVRPGRYRGNDFPSDFEHESMEDMILTSTIADRIHIGAALDEAEGLARAAGRRFGIVVRKRRDVPPERAYVVMTVKTFAALVKERSQPDGRALRALASTPPRG